MLMCDRVDSRPLERLGRFVLAPVAAAVPTLITCPTSVLGKALVGNACANSACGRAGNRSGY